MYNGFLKVAAAVPMVRVADCKHNAERIEALMVRAEGIGAEVVCFPELCLTGYTCQDLFMQQLLLDEAERTLLRIAELSRGLRIAAVVGLPLRIDGALFNVAALVQGGRIQGFVPKTFLPNYKEFYEKRWFAPASLLDDKDEAMVCGQRVPCGRRLLFHVAGAVLGIELCEDLWSVVPPSSMLALGGADIVLNLSASPELVGKHSYLRSLVAQQSARCLCGYVYASCGWGESSQDLVFGSAAMVAENGVVLTESERLTTDEQLIVSEIDVERLRTERAVNTSFNTARQLLPAAAGPWEHVELTTPTLDEERFTLTRPVDALPFVPRGEELDTRCREVLTIQAAGLAQRLRVANAQTAVVGISGGLDSTLALLVAVSAVDRLCMERSAVVGVTMPGMGTTDRTHTNALRLMQQLGVTVREIDIREACEVHFRDLGHDPRQHDVTYENSQARERTQILMDLANKTGGLVVGTGDLSELALGWATYGGDHMSMYGVNASVPKTLVRHLVYWASQHLASQEVADTLLDILHTPVSPELLPPDESGQISQVTEHLVGPYELHDFFLYQTLRFGFTPAKVFALACRAFDGSDERVGSYDEETIKKWLITFYRRFFSQQFKRSCTPDAPKVGSCSLSPRGDWRMPSDASAAAWIAACEAL